MSESEQGQGTPDRYHTPQAKHRPQSPFHPLHSHTDQVIVTHAQSSHSLGSPRSSNIRQQYSQQLRSLSLPLSETSPLSSINPSLHPKK